MSHALSVMRLQRLFLAPSCWQHRLSQGICCVLACSHRFPFQHESFRTSHFLVWLSPGLAMILVLFLNLEITNCDLKFGDHE
jgi:hypothetical protein